MREPVYADTLNIVTVYADNETGEPKPLPKTCLDCNDSGECDECDGEGECTECKHDCGFACEYCMGSGNCPTCGGKRPAPTEAICFAIISGGNFERRIAFDSEYDAEVALAALRDMPEQTVKAMFDRAVAA